ncbi:MAG TPA: hypothetical protein VLJ86_15250 [Ramlibacter sp.]|nr:hypothetical protein [Ramlibacter sp.]
MTHVELADPMNIDLDRKLHEFTRRDEELTRQAGEQFSEMLPRIAARLEADDASAAEVLSDGGFFINDSTVVMRLNAENDHIEFFCDVGLPAAHSQEDAYRVALELNLCRTYPGIILGVHPESRRLVATLSTHQMMASDDEACMGILQMLTLQVNRLRASGVISFQVD